MGLCDLWVLQVRLHQRLLLSGPLPRGLMRRERLLVRLNGPLLWRQGCGMRSILPTRSSDLRRVGHPRLHSRRMYRLNQMLWQTVRKRTLDDVAWHERDSWCDGGPSCLP